jgi:hypothetical protein
MWSGMSIHTSSIGSGRAAERTSVSNANISF